MYFKGELVNLRAITEKDLEYAVQYMNDPEIILNLDDDAPMPLSIENQKKWFEEHLKKKEFHEGFTLAIENKDGKYIGGCGANSIDGKNKIARVFIFIGDKELLGKGYGTEAMKLLLGYIFKELNMNKVKLDVFSFNKRAIKSYEKCGFIVEAVAREAIFRYGNYQGAITMSILKEEYFMNGVI